MHSLRNSSDFINMYRCFTVRSLISVPMPNAFVVKKYLFLELSVLDTFRQLIEHLSVFRVVIGAVIGSCMMGFHLFNFCYLFQL